MHKETYKILPVAQVFLLEKIVFYIISHDKASSGLVRLRPCGPFLKLYCYSRTYIVQLKNLWIRGNLLLLNESVCATRTLCSCLWPNFWPNTQVRDGYNLNASNVFEYYCDQLIWIYCQQSSNRHHSQKYPLRHPWTSLAMPALALPDTDAQASFR